MNRPSVLNLTDVKVVAQTPVITPAAVKPTVARPPVPDDIIRLTSQLIAAMPGGHRVILCTPVEGLANMSRLVINVALALLGLQQGPVLLVDADVYHPTLHAPFGLRLEPGFAGVLRGKATLADALCQTSDPELTILPAGEHTSESSVVARAETGPLFDELRRAFGCVVMLTPGYFESVDAALLAQRADGAVIAATAGKTRRGELMEIKQDFEAIKARLVGVTLVEDR